jgi:isoquinoline 1-oxidoreductase alpha subunit
MTALTIHGEPRAFEGDGATPLLWLLRASPGLTGARYGRGRVLCGAWTVSDPGAG